MPTLQQYQAAVDNAYKAIEALHRRYGDSPQVMAAHANAEKLFDMYEHFTPGLIKPGFQADGDSKKPN